MIRPSAFFGIVPLHSPYMLLALAVVGVSGAAMMMIDPSLAGDAIAPVALLQMFAASSGFAVPARRGHFDLLLTGGASRLRIALTHVAASVLPGLLTWAVLAVVEMITVGTLTPRACASGTVFAMTVISLLAWSLTVALPRLSGGLAWLLLIALALVGWSEWRAAITTAGFDVVDPLTLAAVHVLCPLLLVGERVDAGKAMTLLPALVLASGACAAAVRWITRMDVPLESAQ